MGRYGGRREGKEGGRERREGEPEEKEREWAVKYGEGKGVFDNEKRRNMRPFPV